MIIFLISYLICNMFLWVDPGVRKLWYALIDANKKVIDAGILLSDEKSPTRMDQFARMHDIYEFFVELIAKYPIRAVAMEKLFFTTSNQNNAEYVYGVRGSLGMLFRKHTIPLYEYTPPQLKKSITGSGLASKRAMQLMTQKLFSLEQAPTRHDTADALWLARLALQKTKK